ncbi:protein THEM6 [Hemicordylus capensis]|uniref:protein THEM6 n=1 Tax=Hemicordylus capensis TaxID=884348 RepID=UPI002304213A|nr:protein THEM6 [Hemicordylus capensis]
MQALLVALGAAAGALFALLDGWYLLRMPLTLLYARCLLPTAWDLLEEQTFRGLVLPSDLDFLGHMNNARYLREADLARCVHLTRCGLFRAIRALGAHSVLAASCCRYRRSLRLLERFVVHTRLLGWDERAFVLEQRFVSARDGFVCAVVLVRQHVVGAAPGKAVEQLCRRKVESPEFPEDVLHWLKYNEASSERMKAMRELQKNNKLH